MSDEGTPGLDGHLCSQGGGIAAFSDISQLSQAAAKESTPGMDGHLCSQGGDLAAISDISELSQAVAKESTPGMGGHLCSQGGDLAALMETSELIQANSDEGGAEQVTSALREVDMMFQTSSKCIPCLELCFV
eukprot:gene2486-5441_t